MEPEKFLTLTEFNALRKAAKDDRERCILLLLAGAGLRVGEMTQIIAEDVDFRKGYLHVQALIPRAQANGRVKHTVHPLPSSDSIQIRPPWTSMILFTKARPTPVPSLLPSTL
jgi:integrase